MRIERISETQMKFVLMTDDLEERDIKISELSYASDKTQQLFREIMHLVQDEGEFVSENTPLMFEAMRVGVDSLVVVVTKINEAGGGEKQFNLIPAARQDCRLKKGKFIEPPETTNEDSYVIFSFENIDTMAAGASRLSFHFAGGSQSYKLNDRYFLLLKNETEDNQTTGELENILHEFGLKHVSNLISCQYLVERGEVIIAENAVDKLRMYYGQL
ncbi:MAG: adaptor protein MecA [Defluviitaleaceae bacterium]|nr:adaptor protein MecA [Defluviitaleaceae bacterium]